MTAYTGQTRTTLGQLCAAMGLPNIPGCDTTWNRTRVSVVTPQALRCRAFDRSATRDPVNVTIQNEI
jgi:hypothetical protein